DVSLSVGRVQTPTLAMLVARNLEIKAFVKSAFYTPELDSGAFTAIGERENDTTVAENIRAVCDGKSAIVKSVERVEKAVLPPKLYDLLTLQREANRLYGFTAQQTQDCMQSLYEKKLATYPRTDSRYLTDDTAATLPELLRSLPFVDTSKIAANIPQLINAKEEHEHHALLPTLTAGTIDLASLPNAERSLLQMLCIRVAAAVGDKHIFAETTVKLDCEGSIFTAKGKTIVSEGFKEIEKSLKTDKIEADKSLPDIKEGEVFSPVAATVKEGFTSPPKAYTDDTLLSAMETAGASEFDNAVVTRGIGTAATRSGIIEALIAKDYAKRDKRAIIPTEKGISLITILPKELKSPKLTADWENKLNLVERGEMQEAEFMSGIAGMTQKIITNNRAPNPAFVTLFPAKKRDSIGACPRCNKDVTENEKGFCCIDRSCGFAMWKANKFFTSKKKKLTADIAAELLKNGSVKLSGLHSENTGKSYDAIIGIDDSKNGFVNFKILEFINNGGRK
ncbi:MAG: DNA topoisomerase III, partial [Oscillospiraceae bacterium]|nr:DNA topoisomerase III [Oscillospiraceae bacterium]